VRFGKRHYALLAVFMLASGAVATWPKPVFAWWVAKVAMAKYIHIEGVSPPKIFRFVDDQAWQARGDFVPFTAPQLQNGLGMQLAQEVLRLDGFQSMPNERKMFAGLQPTDVAYSVSWSSYACVVILTVVLLPDNQGNLRSAKSNYGQVGCL
jgi:hypothetical protein